MLSYAWQLVQTSLCATSVKVVRLIVYSPSWLTLFRLTVGNMRMMLQPFVSIVLVVLATLLRGGRVHAFPSEAGSCRAGGNAVGGSHKARTQVGGGPLSDHGLELRLDGTKLQAGVVSQIVVGTSYSLELVATTPTNTFRGFLIRLESPNVDTIEAMSVPENANGIQVSDYFCVNIEGVGGLTHTTSNDKTQVSGLLQVDETAMDLTLDVTVVVQNRPGVSEWYYSQFLLQAISMPPPTPAPVVPTKPPTTTPEPSPAPTMNPTLSPTNKPTGQPSPFPTVSPTLVPVALTQPPSASSWTTRPTNTPTLLLPTNDPTTSPTKQPSQFPSEAPSGAPTMTPSLEPSSCIALSK